MAAVHPVHLFEMTEFRLLFQTDILFPKIDD